MTKLRERMQATGASMRMLADVAGVSSSLVCYIAQGYARFPEYEQLCRVCDFMHCKPTDLYTRTELRRWYGIAEPRRKSKDGSPRIRVDRDAYDYLTRVYGSRVNEVIRRSVRDMAVRDANLRKYVGEWLEAKRDTTGT